MTADELWAAIAARVDRLEFFHGPGARELIQVRWQTRPRTKRTFVWARTPTEALQQAYDRIVKEKGQA